MSAAILPKHSSGNGFNTPEPAGLRSACVARSAMRLVHGGVAPCWVFLGGGGLLR